MLYWTDINRYLVAKGVMICSTQARLNQPGVKETKGLARLQKLLAVKGNIRERMHCLYVLQGIIFLRWHVHNESSLDKVSRWGWDHHSRVHSFFYGLKQCMYHIPFYFDILRITISKRKRTVRFLKTGIRIFSYFQEWFNTFSVTIKSSWNCICALKLSLY